MKGLVMGLTFALTALPASAQDIPNLDRLTGWLLAYPKRHHLFYLRR